MAKRDSTNRKIGILLVQLGTPDSPDTRSVRRFLGEFLSDPRVMDIPLFFRYLLLYLIILPVRSPKSAGNYRNIWSSEGSPLMVYSKSLREKLEEKLNKAKKNRYSVKLCMRYGNPSIKSAIDSFHNGGVSSIKILPLFPQYSSAAAGSVIEAVTKEISCQTNIVPFEVLPPFYNHPRYLQAASFIAEDFFKARKKQKKDFHFLFTFHGLPERQIIKADGNNNHCLQKGDCCDEIGPKNRLCYRAHCVQTAKGVAKQMKLKESGWSFSFQSRLGRAKWLRPYTPDRFKELASSGITRIAVISPSFVADGLETLEELGKQGHDSFINAGGKEYLLIPCVNDHPLWVDALVDMVT